MIYTRPKYRFNGRQYKITFTTDGWFLVETDFDSVWNKNGKVAP